MKILATRVSDAGLYVCVASNIAGNLTQYVELSILGNLELFTFLMYVVIPACLSLFTCLFCNSLVRSMGKKIDNPGLLSPSCSAAEYPGGPQGNEGTGGSSCGAALYGERGPRAHAHMDKGRGQLPRVT